jgi:spore germination protein YaaH
MLRKTSIFLHFAGTISLYALLSVILFLFILQKIQIAHAAGVSVTTTTTITTTPNIRTNQATPTHYLRIFYFREGLNARKSFFAHPGEIDVFAPQNYSITATGTLEGSVAPDLLAFAQENKIKVMPLVVNYEFDQRAAQSLLDNLSEQDSAIAALVAEAKKNGYWGWQLDFEQMNLSYRDKFSAFVQKFGAAMAANGLKSSVAVIAQTSNDPKDYIKNEWQTLIGVYDYHAIGQAVDIVSIMSYDDPQSGGPIARWQWLKQVVNYSLTLIPRNKISVGLGLYYWDWSTVNGKRVSIGGAQGIDTMLSLHPSAKQYFSTVSEAPFIEYFSHKIEYLLWFENSQSIAKKVMLIKTEGLNGFSAWSLGLEVPSVWDAVRQQS